MRELFATQPEWPGDDRPWWTPRDAFRLASSVRAHPAADAFSWIVDRLGDGSVLAGIVDGDRRMHAIPREAWHHAGGASPRDLDDEGTVLIDPGLERATWHVVHGPERSAEWRASLQRAHDDSARPIVIARAHLERALAPESAGSDSALPRPHATTQRDGMTALEEWLLDVWEWSPDPQPFAPIPGYGAWWSVTDAARALALWTLGKPATPAATRAIAYARHSGTSFRPLYRVGTPGTPRWEHVGTGREVDDEGVLAWLQAQHAAQWRILGHRDLLKPHAVARDVPGAVPQIVRDWSADLLRWETIARTWWERQGFDADAIGPLVSPGHGEWLGLVWSESPLPWIGPTESTTLIPSTRLERLARKLRDAEPIATGADEIAALKHAKAPITRFPTPDYTLHGVDFYSLGTVLRLLDGDRERAQGLERAIQAGRLRLFPRGEAVPIAVGNCVSFRVPTPGGDDVATARAGLDLRGANAWRFQDPNELYARADAVRELFGSDRAESPDTADACIGGNGVPTERDDVEIEPAETARIRRAFANLTRPRQLVGQAMYSWAKASGFERKGLPRRVDWGRVVPIFEELGGTVDVHDDGRRVFVVSGERVPERGLGHVVRKRVDALLRGIDT